MISATDGRRREGLHGRLVVAKGTGTMIEKSGLTMPPSMTRSMLGGPNVPATV
jgi:hypothetical protein